MFSPFLIFLSKKGKLEALEWRGLGEGGGRNEEGRSLESEAKQYSIPKTTLRWHVQEANKFPVGKKTKQNIKNPTVLIKEHESDIAKNMFFIYLCWEGVIVYFLFVSWFQYKHNIQTMLLFFVSFVCVITLWRQLCLI